MWFTVSWRKNRIEICFTAFANNDINQFAEGYTMDLYMCKKKNLQAFNLLQQLGTESHLSEVTETLESL